MAVRNPMVARLLIAGTHSGVGKTTLTAGIIAALRRRGLTVQPFKVGPDYIDPTYHTLAAGRPCRNLDTWMVPAERVWSLFARAAQDADVAVIEGVMGLFDGAGYEEEAGSTAEVAKLLGAPVLVVLDASKLARSAGAVAVGYQRFDAGLTWGGFIVNRAASEVHGRGVATAVMNATGLPVIGWLPRAEALHVPERHLGLVPAHEPGRWREFIDAAGDLVERQLDLDRLMAMAGQGGGTSSRLRVSGSAVPAANPQAGRRAAGSPVIAVARDEAFHFMYEDNLDLLRTAGAEIVFFSPLHDTVLPPRTAGVILSGGFPEVYAAPLAANRALHAALHAAHRRGLPIYAECGGLMYLTQAIVDGAQKEHAMAGLLPGRCVMGGRLTLGYRLAQSPSASWFLGAGETVRGHEFHHSAWEGRPDDLAPAYLLLPRYGVGQPQPDGARLGSLWASYVHVHFAANPELAERFVAACRAADAAGGGPWA